MNYQASSIRNVAMIGHGGDGKTTLTEALLFYVGAVDRFGRVEDGNATTDFDPEEIKRHISISTALVPLETNGHKINILDCPGYFDFVGEVTSALSVADGAVIVMSAVSGMVVGTEKAMDASKKAGIPRIIFVGQMDRENASFEKALEQLKSKYGTAIAPIMFPIVNNGVMTGYVDVLFNKAYHFVDKKKQEAEIPVAMASAISQAREILVEAAAENDEELMEKFFSGEALSDDELIKGISLGVADGSTIPVLCGSALDGRGVGCLIEQILHYIPSPEGKVHRGENDQQRICKAGEPFSAYVFKTITDPFVGKLSLFKIYSGELKPSTPLFNANVEKHEKVGSIYIMKGKKQQATELLSAGDIGALAKLQYTSTGHTLCEEGKPIIYPLSEQPKPSISMAVYPKNQGDEDKVFGGLRRLEEEDMTFKLEKNEETNEMLVSGIGELHLEVIARKLKNKFNVEVQLQNPRIPYRETIKKSVKAEGKHKKQSGGHGQYGHCWIEFEPITDGSKNFEFVDKVVGGVVPRQYIPAVEKGLHECIRKGVLAGYPMVGLRATLYDGSYHDVDSSEMAFKIAASLAYKKGCKEANPAILEPIYHIEVLVPDYYMGDIIGDMNKRRGRILGMNPVAEGQMVVAEAPLAELFRYATDLRSMTQARGSFEMHFERYEEAPANVMAKIIEHAKFTDETEE